jgi:hypothetical protein
MKPPKPACAYCGASPTAANPVLLQGSGGAMHPTCSVCGGKLLAAPWRDGDAPALLRPIVQLSLFGEVA